MVAVIVHNPDGGGKVFGLKAALGPGEGSQAARYRREVHAQFRCQRNGSQGIQHVVASGNAQLHAAQFLFPFQDGEQGAAAAFQDVRGGVIRTRPAVGNGIGIAGAYVRCAGMGAAVNDLAPRLGAQLVKHGLDFIQVLVMVQVFRLNVEDDAVLRDVVHQRAVALVPFRHQVFAVLVPVGVGAQHGDFRPYIVARAHAAFPHQVSAEGRGGGFAVRAGDHDALLPVQDGRQAFRAAHAGNVQFARGGKGRIILPDGAGINDDFRVGDGVR